MPASGAGQRDVIEVGDEPVDEIARPGVPHIRPVDDLAEFEAAPRRGEHEYRARWQLWLPTAAIAVVYSASWIWLVQNERGDGALARLVLIIMAIGLPLLCVHAFLRYQTIRLQVNHNAIRYHPGWPKELPVDMPFDLIDKVRVRKGLSGRLFGGGTLVLELTTGERAAIADLAEPEKAKADIEAQMAPDTDSL